MTKSFTQQFIDNSDIPLLWAVVRAQHSTFVGSGSRQTLVQAFHQDESITVAGVPMAGREAVMVEWDAVSNVMRCW